MYFILVHNASVRLFIRSVGLSVGRSFNELFFTDHNADQLYWSYTTKLMKIAKEMEEKTKQSNIHVRGRFWHRHYSPDWIFQLCDCMPLKERVE